MQFLLQKKNPTDLGAQVPHEKNPNQQPCILKAVSLCVVTSRVHKHTLQALNPLPSSQGFGCHSSRSALIQWCLTSYQASLKSFVRERATRRVIWGLCPLAQELHLSSGPCYRSSPELHYRYGHAQLFPLLIQWLLCWFGFLAWPQTCFITTDVSA